MCRQICTRLEVIEVGSKRDCTRAADTRNDSYCKRYPRVADFDYIASDDRGHAIHRSRCASASALIKGILPVARLVSRQTNAFRDRCDRHAAHLNT